MLCCLHWLSRGARQASQVVQKEVRDQIDTGKPGKDGHRHHLLDHHDFEEVLEDPRPLAHLPLKLAQLHTVTSCATKSNSSRDAQVPPKEQAPGLGLSTAC